ncbi:hypothetical protein JCM6882_000116 [Rhodosporidiobolus microsporus]
MQSTRSALHTLSTLSRALPSASPSVLASSSRSFTTTPSSAASFPSFAALRGLLPRRKRDEPATDAPAAPAAASTAPEDKPKSVFDVAAEDEDVALTRQRAGYAPKVAKPATFHKSSTANFKTSRRKLNDLARLIAGRTADEAILQLQASQKKQAPRLLSMVALARDHAMAKGLRREELVVSQSWVTKGHYLTRLDIKGRGRFGVKHHPSAKLHVLLAEGLTDEERKRQRKKDQWRASIRGLTEGDGVGVGQGGRKIINANVGGWRW